jgi:HAD superfamily hydrolase (TIGR01450 family)
MRPPASAQDLLNGYEAMRRSLPTAEFPKQWSRAKDLESLANDYDAFFFDAYGVLNLGDTPIAGAAERLQSLRRAGRIVKMVSNAGGMPPSALCKKYQAMGFDFDLSDLVTSREALTQELRRAPPRLWGVMAPAGADTSDLPGPVIHLGDQPTRMDEAEGFLLFTSLHHDPDARVRLQHNLIQRPRPVWVANADLAAPREIGFSVEPGALAQWLAHHTPVQPRLFGKPFAPVFDLALQRLPGGISPSRVLMIGDTLHTDILGGCRAGLHTALVVAQGASADLNWEKAVELTGIVPHHVIDHI